MSDYREHRRQNLAEQERHEARVRREIQEMEAQREYDERFAPMATMSDSHAEWHRNAGVPMGTPGCPQDACHPPEDWRDYEEPEPVKAVRCGNKRTHGAQVVYHPGAEGVRACYENQPGAALNQVSRDGSRQVPDSEWLEG